MVNALAFAFPLASGDIFNNALLCAAINLVLPPRARPLAAKARAARRDIVFFFITVEPFDALMAFIDLVAAFIVMRGPPSYF
jgi:hypothetical protein